MSADYFAKRGLRRYAGVIAGHYSGWNLGLMAGGWGGLALATVVVAAIQGMLLNMAVAGATLSYLLQAVSFMVLRRRLPDLKRPYRSPLGIAGAVITLVIAIVTLVFQLLDPVFVAGVFRVGVWFVLGVIWFALVGQNRLVLAPEEAFAMEKARR